MANKPLDIDDNRLGIQEDLEVRVERVARDNAEVVGRLVALPGLDGIPRDQIEWLVEHGEVHRCDDGATLYGNDGFNGLVIVIAGRFSVRVNQNGVERELRGLPPGHISGFLPYSRMTTPRGYLVADGPVEFLLIRQEDFREMTRACYEFTGACVQEMLARARVFKSDDKRQEKMAALGRLSAGLSHELNNPAATILRSARELEVCRANLAAAARKLGRADLSEESRIALQALEAAAQRTRIEPIAPVHRAEVEDRLVEWLGGHGVDPAVGYQLAETTLTAEDLEASALAIDSADVPAVITYVAANAAARGLEADILSAAARIRSLVSVVKKHTHMDRAPVVEEIGLGSHLADTVTLLGSKASLKEIALDVTIENDLPMIMGSVADLNQVWIHLIDNAIDAATTSGRVTIDARRGHDTVVVRVVDDGPGIAREDQERVFEPFFTTKDVGQGRGLGLDVVRTVVQAHRGLVELISQPGRTEFCVTLPVAVASA